MSSTVSPSDNPPPTVDRSLWKPATFTSALAVLAFVVPLTSGEVVPRVAGLLLIGAAGAQALHGFRRTTFPAQRAAWTSSGVTLGIAVLLLSAPFLAGTALALFLAAPFVIHGVRYCAAAIRFRHGSPGRALIGAAMNLAIVAAILVLRQMSVSWTIAIASGLRILSTTWEMLAQPVFSEDYAETSVVDDLALRDAVRFSRCRRIRSRSLRWTRVCLERWTRSSSPG